MLMTPILPRLLDPIGDHAPCGVDLRSHGGGDPDYFQLKDLRSSARALERQADSDEEAQSSLPDWQRIRDLCATLLERRTKDIEIAVWLVEAQVRLDGFSGLADGFRLLSGLVSRYWDDLLPLPDQDGLAVRLSPVGGLNGIGTEGTLIQPIRKVPLLPAENGAASVAFWHYQLAQRAASQTESRPAKPGRPAPPDLDDLKNRLTALNEERKALLIADIRLCRMAFAELDQHLSRLCGADAPPSSAIAHLLEEIEDAAVFLTGYRGPTPEAGAPSAEVAPDAGGAVTLSPEAIGSREAALRQLEEIGRFFRRTEPHSPLSYSIEDLVRRGRMPWPDLLAELLQDQGARNSLLTAAGIKPPQT
jgi:type VI secretion system protein ImpA